MDNAYNAKIVRMICAARDFPSTGIDGRKEAASQTVLPTDNLFFQVILQLSRGIDLRKAVWNSLCRPGKNLDIDYTRVFEVPKVAYN